MSEQGLTVLVNKYAELSGRLLALDKEARVIKASMSHLHASIRLIRNGYDVAAIQPKNPYKHNPYIKRGTYVRLAIDILREAGRPLSCREICCIAFQRYGAEADEKLVKRTTRTMETCLMKKAKEGRLTIYKEYHPKRFSV